MIAAWMAYSASVGVLAGLAAWALEAVLRGRTAATRWPWAAALGVTLVLPARALLVPGAPAPEPQATGGALTPEMIAALRELGAAGPSLLARLDLPLGVAWAVGSTLLLVGLAGGFLRLSLRSRRWRPARVADEDVLVSDDFGPAALGLRVARVVLPRWALELDDHALRLIVAHEREHGRAGDARLLLLGVLAVSSAPWNPALWWQLRRLRAAVEIDCDRRVVRTGASPAAYGRLLLEIGARTRRAPFPVPGLARPRSLLERRMTMIVRGAKRTGTVTTAGAAAVAALLLAAACEAPAPTGLQPRSDAPAASSIDVAPEAERTRVMAAEVAGPEPLVYVDDERVDGVPDDLAPERIERVEVLKGAAAEALLGAEAAGGVVRIYTKAAALRGPAPDESELRFPVGGPTAPDASGPRVYVDGERFAGDLGTLDPTEIARIDVVGAEDGRTEIRILRKPSARR